jgi:ComEC/Rec2-related protein
VLAEEVAHGHGFLFVPVLLGAGAATWFSLPQDPAPWPLLVVFLACGGLAVSVRHAASNLRHLPFGAALFCLGMLLAGLEVRRLDTVILDTPVTTDVRGVVERRELDSEGRWRYVLRLEATANPQIQRQPQRISLLSRSPHEPAVIGSLVGGRARLSPPSGPALSGLNDFAFSSYFDGIGAVGFFYGKPQISDGTRDLPSGLRTGIREWLFDLRSTVGNRIRAAVPGDPGAFAAAIVTDERRAISDETTEALRLSGLAHIVAISGLNMALAAGIFFVGVRTALSLFPRIAQTYPIKKIAALGALLMVTAYYLISGFGVSAERAYIMMAVILVAVLLDRQSLSLRNVALSALIIVVMSPSEILGPSFQMSFAATAALIAGYAAWQRRKDRVDAERPRTRHRMIASFTAVSHFTAGIIMTSLIGSLSTAMFSVDHFHRIATYGLAANLASMPLISFVVMPAGLVAMLLMPFGLDAPFLTLMGWGLQGVIAIAHYVAAWGGDVGVGRQHAWFLALSAVGFVLLTLLRTRLRLMGLPFIVLALCLSIWEAQKPLPDLLVSEDGTMVGLLDERRVATNRTRPPDFIYDQWRRALNLPEPIKPSVSPAGDNGGNSREDDARPPETGKASGEGPGLSPAHAALSAKAGTGTASKERLPDLTDSQRSEASDSMRQASTERFNCVIRAWCAVRAKAGPVIVVVEDARYAGTACDAAAIVVAARARFDHCRSGALMINGETLRRTGAMEISFNGAEDRNRWTMDAAMAGKSRPWTRHRLYDWRSRRFNGDLPPALAELINGSGGSAPPASPGP